MVAGTTLTGTTRGTAPMVAMAIITLIGDMADITVVDIMDTIATGPDIIMVTTMEVTGMTTIADVM